MKTLKFSLMLFLSIGITLSNCKNDEQDKKDKETLSAAFLLLQNQATFLEINGKLSDTSGTALSTHKLVLSTNVSSRIENPSFSTQGTSYTSDTSGYFSIQLSAGSYKIRVYNSSDTEVGSFTLNVNSASDKPKPENLSGLKVSIIRIGSAFNKASGFTGLSGYTWLSNFGGFNKITTKNWGLSTIEEIDSNNNVVYIKDTTETAYVAGYSRIRFTSVDTYGNFRYCIETYGKQSLEEAKAVNTSYTFSSDTTANCGGFSWSIMSLAPEYMQVDISIAGTGTDNYGQVWKLLGDKYSGNAIYEFNNNSGVFYYQNAYNATYNPNKFGRIRYTKPANKVFYYCIEIYDGISLEAVQSDTTKVYTFESESSKTCGGFTWSKVSLN
ncbi:MAG: hypothetical protein H7A25_06915 [Leptospiraceae bacterium]|nr:hypothetical protein [Leptospiraceae bacterium]MCP5499618.1 hypothetical protein [Leptospiraceae bacterium]